MTTSNNLLTLGELLAGSEPGFIETFDDPLEEQDVHQHGNGSEQYADCNAISDDLGNVFSFPSCYAARQTVEGEWLFITFRQRIESLSTGMEISLEEALKVCVEAYLKDVTDTTEKGSDLPSVLGEHFARLCVTMWALVDAYFWLKNGRLIEEGSGETMWVKPISEDIYGVGGRVFASNLWDWIVVIKESAEGERP